MSSRLHFEGRVPISHLIHFVECNQGRIRTVSSTITYVVISTLGLPTRATRCSPKEVRVIPLGLEGISMTPPSVIMRQWSIGSGSASQLQGKVEGAVGIVMRAFGATIRGTGHTFSA